MNFTLTITASPELLEAIGLLTGMVGPRTTPPAPANTEPTTPVLAAKTRKVAAPAEAKEEVKPLFFNRRRIDPFTVLGPHKQLSKKTACIRAILPSARQA